MALQRRFAGEPLAHLLEMEKAPALKTWYAALAQLEETLANSPTLGAREPEGPKALPGNELFVGSNVVTEMGVGDDGEQSALGRAWTARFFSNGAQIAVQAPMSASTSVRALAASRAMSAPVPAALPAA